MEARSLERELVVCVYEGSERDGERERENGKVGREEWMRVRKGREQMGGIQDKLV